MLTTPNMLQKGIQIREDLAVLLIDITAGDRRQCKHTLQMLE